MKKRFGFTLAEVLITLGIIGVVAAMTIPTLIANTNSAKFRSQFKKTISTLNQAGLMAEAQYDFNYAGVAHACNATTPGEDSPSHDTAERRDTMCSILNGTLTGQTVATTRQNAPDSSNIKTTQIQTPGNFIYYSLSDGSMVAIPKTFAVTAENEACTLNVGETIDEGWVTKHTANCLGYIDVNGKTLPNREVTCSADASGNTSATEANNAALTPWAACTVASDSTHMTDIFPVFFHDATVEPATNAAKAVLATAK